MNEKNIIPMERWPSLLPMYVAEHESSPDSPLFTLEEIAEHFDITIEQVEKFKVQPTFQAEVRACLAEVKDSNSVIRQKAKAQLETYLDHMIPQWMADIEFPPAEKVKLLKQITEWAEAGGSVAEKAKSKLETITAESQKPQLNIFITPAGGGEPVLTTGITITQDDEKAEVIENSKEKKDADKKT